MIALLTALFLALAAVPPVGQPCSMDDKTGPRIPYPSCYDEAACLTIGHIGSHKCAIDWSCVDGWTGCWHCDCDDNCTVTECPPDPPGIGTGPRIPGR